MSKNIAFLSRNKENLSKLCGAAMQFLPDFNFYDIEADGFKGAFSVILLGEISELRESKLWEQIENIDSHKKYYVCNDTSEQVDFLSDEWIRVSAKQILIGVLANIKEAYKEKMQKGMDFLPLEVSDINKELKITCDFYIRLSSGKFVKTFLKGSLLGEQYDQYIEKGLDKIWIEVGDFYNMGNDYLEEVFSVKELLKSPQTEINKHIENIHNISRQLGIKQNVIDHVGEMMGTFTAELKSDEMKSLIDTFNHQSGSFLFNHSYLLALLCSSVSKRMDWDSKENQEKFCLASIFHDLGYEDDINSLMEIGNPSRDLNTPQAALSDVDNHEKGILKRLDGLKLHPDILKMIKYHHYGEMVEGKDRELVTGRLNHHCCIFIMSHDLIVELYKVLFRKEKVENCLNVVLEKYNSGIFKSISKVFDTEVRRMFAVKV